MSRLYGRRFAVDMDSAKLSPHAGRRPGTNRRPDTDRHRFSLGAGSIIQSKGNVRGLTTAACIWVIAIIGHVCGRRAIRTGRVAHFRHSVRAGGVGKDREKETPFGRGQAAGYYIRYGRSRYRLGLWIPRPNTFLFVFNVSTESDYSAGKSTLTLRVQVREKDTLKRLFLDLRACCPEIARIGIYDV